MTTPARWEGCGPGRIAAGKLADNDKDKDKDRDGDKEEDKDGEEGFMILGKLTMHHLVPKS